MSTPLSQHDFYHVGVVVKDMTQAMAAMSAVGGYQWTRIQENRLTVRVAGDDQVVDFRYVFSLELPYLELVQELPMPPWNIAGESPHHMGYWVDDLAQASADLAAAGFAVEACGVSPDGVAPFIFTYQKGPDGIRVELVDRSVRASLEERVARSAAALSRPTEAS